MVMHLLKNAGHNNIINVANKLFEAVQSYYISEPQKQIKISFTKKLKSD
jgi:phosphopantetheine adenylyltransferase